MKILRPNSSLNSPAARKRARKPRRGTTAVEVALCFPLFFTVLMSSIEFTRANMLRNGIANAAYEGARVGIVPGATAALVEAEARRLLAAVSANGATVTVTPAIITSTTQEVSVSISVPLNQNLWVINRFTGNKILNSTCTLQVELTGF